MSRDLALGVATTSQKTETKQTPNGFRRGGANESRWSLVEDVTPSFRFKISLVPKWVQSSPVVQFVKIREFPPLQFPEMAESVPVHTIEMINFTYAGANPPAVTQYKRGWFMRERPITIVIAQPGEPQDLCVLECARDCCNR